jgi:hypothetical protein
VDTAIPASLVPPPVHSLVEPLDTSTDPVERAQRAAILADHRRSQIALHHQLLIETGKPHPRLSTMLANDEAYLQLIVEAYA